MLDSKQIRHPGAPGRLRRATTGPWAWGALAGLIASILLGAVAAYLAGRADLRFGLALAALTGTTVAVIVRNVRAGEGFSAISLSAFFYLLAFGGGAIYFRWLVQDFETPSGDLVLLEPLQAFLSGALVIAAVAWVMFVAGYYLAPLRRVPTLGSVLPRRPPPVVLAVSCLGLGWLSRLQLVASGRYFHTVIGGEVASTGSSWLVFALSTLPLFATGLLGAVSFLDDLDPRRRRLLRRAFWTLALVELAWALPSGERGQVVGVVLMIGVVRYYGGRTRMNRPAIVAAVAFLALLVFPMILEYRDPSQQYQQNTRVALTHALEKTVKPNPGKVASAGVTATFSRFSDITALAAIRSSGRQVFDRRPGETLLWGASGFVPRAIWPSKHDPGAFGNEFGRTYGIISGNDFGTSISITQAGEAYVNFGMLGLLLVMPLVGALYRLLDRFLRHRRTDPFTLAIYSTLAWPLISSQETITANGLTGIVKVLVIFGIVIIGVSAAYRLVTGATGTRRTPRGMSAEPS